MHSMAANWTAPCRRFSLDLETTSSSIGNCRTKEYGNRGPDASITPTRGYGTPGDGGIVGSLSDRTPGGGLCYLQFLGSGVPRTWRWIARTGPCIISSAPELSQRPWLVRGRSRSPNGSGFGQLSPGVHSCWLDQRRTLYCTTGKGRAPAR